jgi:hypothetical protein
MIRCDNDECPLSRQCTRFLIYPTDADGVESFKPRTTDRHDWLLNTVGISEADMPMIRTECDYFIELAQVPDNNN